MSSHVVEWTQKCKSCKGSGIYVGFAERDGAGVVCHRCDGKGFQNMKFDYEDFEERTVRDDVEQIFPHSGYVVGPSIQGGIPYKLWLKDPEAILHPRYALHERTCPAQWVQGNLRKQLDWDKCKEGMTIGIQFKQCKFYEEKYKCWTKIFEEYKEKEDERSAEEANPVT